MLAHLLDAMEWELGRGAEQDDQGLVRIIRGAAEALRAALESETRYGVEATASA